MDRLIAKTGVVIIILTILIAPWFSHAEYNWLHHTTSNLGGQNMPHAWIMNIGFFCYGAGTATGSVMRLRRIPARASAIILFGSGLVGTALFSTGSNAFGLQFDQAEDWWHSFFASLIGVAFALATAIRLFAPDGGLRDYLSWVGLFASAAIPLAMTSFPEFSGLLQRGMFAISFIWIWREFSLPAASAANQLPR